MDEAAMRWYVVVLDDRGEFALHVWRYLDRSLSIGTHPSDGSDGNWLKEGEVVPFLDGANRFCWLHADSGWNERLRRFLDSLQDGWSLLAIVDVNGKGSYDPKDVLSRLDDWKRSGSRRVEVRVVSAYHIGAQIREDVEVLPKSRSTLNEMRRLLCSGSRPSTPDPQARHVLVTGAGFEIKNPRGGFGMLATPELLKNMGKPFLHGKPPEKPEDDVIYLVDVPKSLPVPAGGRWSRYELIEDAARKNELDKYWDLIFTKELAYRIGDFTGMVGFKREETAAQALLSERRMREAFRRSIRNHDWGHMNQSLAAAGLPWNAWLTTNYTRFADRAIALMAAQEWRIISTGTEANLSIREEEGRRGASYRYLFKLHGDVGHLHTMAIAGYDKDIFSPLSVTVDNLYQVYASAERILRHPLREGPVVWHIVGHAMGDRRLTNLMIDVCEQVKGKHLFLIANPKPNDPYKNLKAHLAERRLKHPIKRTKLLADEYMARLARTGLPASADLDELIEWFEALPPGAETLRSKRDSPPPLRIG